MIFNIKSPVLLDIIGVGKTNVMDAIYYLSFAKSYFNSVAIQNIRHGEEFFMVEGNYQMSDREESIVCSLKKGQKKIIKRQRKGVRKIFRSYWPISFGPRFPC